VVEILDLADDIVVKLKLLKLLKTLKVIDLNDVYKIKFNYKM